MIAQRLYSFLVVFLLMFLGRSFGQQTDKFHKLQGDVCQLIIPNKRMPQIGIATHPRPADHGNFFGSYKTLKKLKFEEDLITGAFIKDTSSKKIQPQFLLFKQGIPGSFYTSQLGFICKKELQLDKLTPLPFRFRLGSLAYVNYLEQKPNAINPQR